AAGTPVANGTTDAAFWSVNGHTGGVISPDTFTDVWAMCATFAAPAGPTPTPSPAPSPGLFCGAHGGLTPGGDTCTYTIAGTHTDRTAGTDTFKVPPGVNAVTIDLYGGQGGAAHGFIGTESGGAGAPGGMGGHTHGVVQVTPGQQLQVTVGAAGIEPD